VSETEFAAAWGSAGDPSKGVRMRLAKVGPAAPWARCAGVGLAALLASACAAERTITITSEPPGALVRLDDTLVGVTPVKVPFLHYGTRRVTWYLDGYRTESRLVPIRAPWYAGFPVDILTEVVLPIGWKNNHSVHEDLARGDAPALEPELRAVIDRAETIRRAGPSGPKDLPPADGSGQTAADLPAPLGTDEPKEGG
jgi:ABC-type amino acid transport substrate-binding protein